MLTVLNDVLWLCIVAGVALGGGVAARRIGVEAFVSNLYGAGLALALLVGLLLPWSDRIADEPAPVGANVTGPCSHAPSRQGVGSVDSLAESSTNRPLADGDALEDDSALIVTGWAVMHDKSAPATGVCVYADGLALPATVSYGLSRPDVATALGRPADVASGFTLRVDPRDIQSGSHEIIVAAEESDGQTATVGKRTLVKP